MNDSFICTILLFKLSSLVRTRDMCLSEHNIELDTNCLDETRGARSLEAGRDARNTRLSEGCSYTSGPETAHI
jgi:hypothetical protein